MLPGLKRASFIQSCIFKRRSAQEKGTVCVQQPKVTVSQTPQSWTRDGLRSAKTFPAQKVLRTVTSSWWHVNKEAGKGEEPRVLEIPQSTLSVTLLFLKKISIYLFGSEESQYAGSSTFIAAYGIQFSDQGWNPGPPHWEHRVLTTGPPGKSFLSVTLNSNFFSFVQNLIKCVFSLSTDEETRPRPADSAMKVTELIRGRIRLQT